MDTVYSQVPLVNAVLIEFALTFVVRFVTHGGGRFPYAEYGPVLPALTMVFATLIGMTCSSTYVAYYCFSMARHLTADTSTGGFYNPAIAFSQQFNCEGHDNYEFMAVYVMGPLIAAYLVGVHADDMWDAILPFKDDPGTLPPPQLIAPAGSTGVLGPPPILASAISLAPVPNSATVILPPTEGDRHPT